MMMFTSDDDSDSERGIVTEAITVTMKDVLAIWNDSESNSGKSGENNSDTFKLI